MSKYKDFPDDYEDAYPPFNPIKLFGAIVLGILAWYMVTNATSPTTPPTPPAVVVFPTSLPTPYPTPELIVVVVTATPDPLATELAQSVQRIRENEAVLSTSVAKVDGVATEVAAVVEVAQKQEARMETNESTNWYIQLAIICLAIGIVLLAAMFLLVNSSPTYTPTPTPYTIGQLGPEPHPLPEVAPVAPENGARTVLGTVQSAEFAPVVLRPNSGRYFDPVGPMTEHEQARIISSYARFQSKTAVCKAVYGYKNQNTLARVSQIIRPE